MKYLESLLPLSFSRKIDIRRQERELRKMQAIICNVDSLRNLERGELQVLFQLNEIAEKWEKAHSRIDQFRLPDGTGGVNPGDRQAIFYLINGFTPNRVLEVGTHIGASTVHIATALSETATMTTVDIRDVNDRKNGPWLHAGADRTPKDMIAALGCLEKVTFLTESSIDYLVQCKDKFDFIFLDGDHSAKMVYLEVPAALRLLNPNGLILLHDYFPGSEPLWADGALQPGPYLAIERLKAEGASLTVLPLGEIPWPTKQGSNVTSLALLARTGG